MAPPLLAGLVSILPLPPLSSGLARTYTTNIRHYHTVLYLAVLYALPPPPFVCSNVIFLFLGETKETERKRYSWLFLFELFCLNCKRTFYCFIFLSAVAGWIQPLRTLTGFLCKSDRHIQRTQLQTDSPNYDSILSPALHMDRSGSCGFSLELDIQYARGAVSSGSAD